MPKAGQVRVRLNRRMTAETADWLCTVYRPPKPTVLGGGNADDVALGVQHARTLSTVLRKIAVRRRPQEDFTCAVDREAAQWLGHLWEAALYLGGRALLADNEAGFILLPFDVRRTLRSFHVASHARRGRKNLTIPQLEDQLGGRIHRGSEDDAGRHRRRALKDLKYERDLREWLLGGNTVLGSPETVPKK